MIGNVYLRSGTGCLLAFLFLAGGCAQYSKVVQPTSKLAQLSPELASLTDEKIELYLRSTAKPQFPTVLAVAKLRELYRYHERDAGFTLASIQGREADGWLKLAKTSKNVNQVHFVSPLLLQGSTNLKNLRDAAALVHAPLLLVYLETENAAEGYNSSAMAYWSIVGLFVVPGNTVGHYTLCQAILVDTRTGVIVATAQSDSIKEENVLFGAVEIARDRVKREAHEDAVTRLQNDFHKTLDELVRSSK